MSPQRVSLPTAMAFALALLGTVIAVISKWTDALDAWLPNIATELWAIAVTVLVVERIVRHEERRLADPHVQRALGYLKDALRLFADRAAIDYASTHNASHGHIPGDVVGMLRRWLQDIDEQDRNEIGATPPRFVAYGIELCESVCDAVDRHRDWLPDDVLEAVDALDSCRRQAEIDFALANAGALDRATWNEGRAFERGFFVAALALAEVVGRRVRGFALDDGVLEKAEQVRLNRFPEP